MFYGKSYRSHPRSSEPFHYPLPAAAAPNYRGAFRNHGKDSPAGRRCPCTLSARDWKPALPAQFPTMELQPNHQRHERRSAVRTRPAAASRWSKQWVPQNLVSQGGKCSLLKWVREDPVNATREKSKETELEEDKSDPATEVLFLCSYEGCGKTFIDAMALRKHSHVHGERQYVCQFEGCGKKFGDSSKLKRHFLIHTGEKDFVCTYEGCGKAFSLDFNLRAHMKTHSLENYRVCPYEDCGRRYTNESKLRSHIKAVHEKNSTSEVVKPTPKAEKVYNTPKTPAAVYGSASSDRPYACPYEGCGKAYIHEYKLNLHLRTLHPGHNSEDNGKQADHDMDEASDQEAYTGKGSRTISNKRSKPSPIQKTPPSKAASRKAPIMVPLNINTVKKPWPTKAMYEDDSEETEEDNENTSNSDDDDDDEETEDED